MSLVWWFHTFPHPENACIPSSVEISSFVYWGNIPRQERREHKRWNFTIKNSEYYQISFMAIQTSRKSATYDCIRIASIESLTSRLIHNHLLSFRRQILLYWFSYAYKVAYSGSRGSHFLHLVEAQSKLVPCKHSHIINKCNTGIRHA